MQADVPGGHAAGADVALDEEDMAFQRFMQDEYGADAMDEDSEDELTGEIVGYRTICNSLTTK